MRRTQLLVRRTRSISKAIPTSHRALILGARSPRLSTPRKSSTASATKTRTVEVLPEQRPPLITTASGPPDGNDPDSTPGLESSADAVEAQLKEAVKEPVLPDMRPRLPNGLNILWTPEVEAETSSAASNAIPPENIMNQVLANFHLTLHPQIQHKAAYASDSGPLTEPTFALYCPIEGGDYILDATVRELGHRAGADVVVIDAAHLAAGESGHFGKAASVLQLKYNPLHFSLGNSRASRSQEEDDYDSDDDMHLPTPMMGHLTMQIMSPSSSRPPRGSSSRRSSPSMSQLKAFFQEIINVSPPPIEGAERLSRRPRIIYVRDFPTLASSSSAWYPALLAAVRDRRQGALARPTSPVFNPTTIVFGVTPSISDNEKPFPSHDQGSSPSSKSARSKGKKVQDDQSHNEDDIAEKARDKRLRDRLRKWEKGDKALHDEVPRLQTGTGESLEGSPFFAMPGPVMVVDAPNGIPPSLSHMLGMSKGGFSPASSSRRPSEPSGGSSFFRTSVVLPSARSPNLEKACRMDRRRELNELAMRMAVSTVGGTLGTMLPGEPSETGSPFGRMWTDWGHSVVSWSHTRQIADIVVGQAARALHEDLQKGSIATLDASQVEWPSVFDAWAGRKDAVESRKAFLKQILEKDLKEDEDDRDEEDEDDEVDDVVAQIKRDAEDGELDPYESKLVSCIVDAGSITTTFNKVHLPPHTIDSVRTIVSLPLLHPDAFSHGILKEHNMTGCLLFGPPGTGKTLLVRALAKEAGCRMLAISPSDVMDMYVGEAEKSVRAIFSLARRLAPCVVFIDELDAMFGARSSGSISGGDHAHRGVITEFMQEMDGLKSSKEDNIMVIGATNRPFDLDDAVLRRLPRRLLVDLPGEKEREEILKILLRDETLADDVDFTTLSKRTAIFSGSDLKHLCVSAALNSVKEHVNVPWRESLSDSETKAASNAATPEQDAVSLSNKSTTQAESVESSSESDEAPSKPPRILAWRNFEAALKEITPSSSESLGTLADLRKWNQEFGEGRKERKKQVWGKDRFGFTLETLRKGESKVQTDEGAVAASALLSPVSTL